jgi:DNA segregation ATPase FtsK/SpoIIIE-like protein
MTAFRSLPIIPPRLKKAVTKIFVLFIVLSSLTWIAPQKASAQVYVNFQIFYDNLSPYGDWVDNSDYGYVWVPRVSHRFCPYGTNGHWVFTHAGWTWFSNYSWGWAPFHYGRWFYDSYYGWVWVPDNEWGPGWVTWRRSEGYYGWAPIGPGISIDFAYSSGYSLPYDRWRFVRDRDFGRTDINNYYVSTSNYTTIINNSTVINNIQVDNSQHVSYNAGPDRTEVEGRVGKTFAPLAIKESTRPAQNLSKDQLEIYRPQVQKNISAAQKPAPTKVVGWKGKQQPTQQQRDGQEAKQQQQQRNDQKVKQQQQQQRNDQEAKQQQQRNGQEAKQQQQQQRNDQEAKQQQQQQRNDQEAKQQQQRRNDQEAKQQQQQRNDQQVKQRPTKEKQSQPPKNNPSKKVKG